MEEIKLRAFDRPAGISALTCGIAFGIAAVIYAVIPALSGFLWCFYFGYGLTVATGANPKNFKRYIACFLCGALWAIPYWYGTDWIMSLGVQNLLLARFITEFVLNTALVYVHLHLLKMSWASIPPCVFAGITTVFGAKGWIGNVPYCQLSLFLGMSFCLLATIAADRWIAWKQH